MMVPQSDGVPTAVRLPPGSLTVDMLRPPIGGGILIARVIELPGGPSIVLCVVVV